MTDEKIVLAPCNRKVYEHGHCVCTVYGKATDIERWVRLIAEKANAIVDWHYAAGLARILHLGRSKSRQRVLLAIREHKDRLVGRIFEIEE